MHTRPSALTLDLDDTLWPIWPTISRAESVLHDWLSAHAPATARRFDRAALRSLRDEVALQNPQWAHDLSAIGDDFQLDVAGAINAGLRAVWLRREVPAPAFDPASPPGACHVFQDLSALADALIS